MTNVQESKYHIMPYKYVQNMHKQIRQRFLIKRICRLMFQIQEFYLGAGEMTRWFREFCVTYIVAYNHL